MKHGSGRRIRQAAQVRLQSSARRSYPHVANEQHQRLDEEVMRLSAAGETHSGRRRENNEDFVLVRNDLRLFVVADGVGGERTGEVASRLASLSMANFFEATLEGQVPDTYRDHLDLSLQDGAQRLSAAIRKANTDVYTIASTSAQHDKMSTTVVAAYVPRNEEHAIHIGHVGDSRCYRVRDGRIEQLTRDHTLRNQARDERPDLGEERIAQIPESVLYRAVGRSHDVDLTMRSLELRPNDRILLCSDGVTKMVSDPRILDVVMAADTPAEGCGLLVDLANEAGGRDNITAVLLWPTDD